MSKIRIRKSVYDLTKEERHAFRRAFAKMYAAPCDRYFGFADTLVRYGHATWNDMDFLTWNRAFFLSFEDFIREQGEEGASFLPYWNYTSKRAISKGMPKLFAKVNYFDLEEKKVKPNPFYKVETPQKLLTYRTYDNSDTTPLSKARSRAKTALKANDYVTFSNLIWRMDATGHAWIGGTMTELSAAPFDPLFWFIHCNLDRFWWEFQHKKGVNKTIPPTVLGTPLSPFSDSDGKRLMGKDVVNTENLGYTYRK